MILLLVSLENALYLLHLAGQEIFQGTIIDTLNDFEISQSDICSVLPQMVITILVEGKAADLDLCPVFTMWCQGSCIINHLID